MYTAEKSIRKQVLAMAERGNSACVCAGILQMSMRVHFWRISGLAK